MFTRLDLEHPKPLIIICSLLVVLTIFTHYYGSTDLADYSDTARYFAGHYAADIRSSHSYLYGFLHAPLIYFFDTFFVFKITSLLILGALVYSVYLISGKNRKALALILLSPVVWYMAPWISPIQLASLCMLWAYYWITRYDVTHSIRHLLYSGILIGAGLAVWDTVLFFGAFLLLPFLWNKKAYHVPLVVVAIGIGLVPRLVLDYSLFGFPFFSLLKSFVGTLTNAFFLGRGSTYAGGLANVAFFLLILLSIPLYLWRMYIERSSLWAHKKTLIFFTLSVVLILINPQIRYTLILVPIAVVLAAPRLSEVQWKKHVIFSSLITLLFIAPIALQTAYSFNESEYYDITEVLAHINDLHITRHAESYYLVQDLDKIAHNYPNQTFIVFGQPDYYQKLAHLYWGSDVAKFVSEQDYMLWKKNESTLFEKKLLFVPRINDRRAIWIGGGILKNPHDETNYDAITYAIAFNDTSVDPAFRLERTYERLVVLSKREGNRDLNTSAA